MSVENIGPYLSPEDNEDLERIRNSVLAMGGLVEEQFDRAIRALSDADSVLGLQVARDDAKVNKMEVAIDEECSRILTTGLSTPSDLTHVKQMIHGALDSLARLDDQGALEVVKSDEIVDEEYETIYRQGITFMMEDPRTIRQLMDLTWLARALERIGDHAKNICEYVIFAVHGKDIRHTGLENIEAALAQLPKPQRIES